MEPSQEPEFLDRLMPYFERLRECDLAGREDLARELTTLVTLLSRPHLRRQFSRLRGILQTDDVVQEVMLRNLPSLEQLPCTDVEVKAYINLLRLIIHHTLLDLARKYFGPHGWLTKNKLGGAEAEDDGTTDHHSRLDLGIDLQKVLAELPEKDAELLRFRYWHGMEIQEIAALLDKDRGTIRRHLRRIEDDLGKRFGAQK